VSEVASLEISRNFLKLTTSVTISSLCRFLKMTKMLDDFRMYQWLIFNEFYIVALEIDKGAINDEKNFNWFS